MTHRVLSPEAHPVLSGKQLESLRRGLAAVKVPPRLWWSIRLRLWFVPRHQRDRLRSGVSGLALGSALCSCALLWLGLSTWIIESTSPMRANRHVVARLLPEGQSQADTFTQVTQLGEESLALLGLPYLGVGELGPNAATRRGEWITLPGGEVLGLRLLDEEATGQSKPRPQWHQGPG